ncbi:MAG: tRNA (adenosine(37)-N6)-threonylcarbamoyltransferase complex dimerization subunit type 1 TsaB [Erysipelotrichaceae bacterium]|nr:tRNA (adenosine(37)-N6)-threonylcarbamoyltransferase complex dimerization subunit type 1 TsaB [Erysipelotrichaceae bacterium]
MNILCIDTSHRFLAVGILKDGQPAASFQKECWKKQSEELFPALQEVMDQAGLSTEDIDGAVITEGPGSYTGVRIAMTVAKVFCAMGNKPLYTISTLRLYAGMLEDCRVVLDARGQRAYTAVYSSGEEIEAPSVRPCGEISGTEMRKNVVGDGRLIGRDDCWPDLIGCFAACRAYWKKADNIHLVVPEYLKANEAYLVKK